MTDIDTRPLPVSRQLLDEHYMPPPPSTGPVPAARAVDEQLGARSRHLAEQLAVLQAAAVAALVDDPNAAIDVTALATLRAAADIVDQAAAQAHTYADSLAATDPDWQAWRTECAAVLREWLDARQLVDTDSSDDRDERVHRSLAGFAARH